MHTLKQTIFVKVLVLFFLVVSFLETAQAKSVYAITDRDSTVKAYRVIDERIEEQTYAKNLDDHEEGAVGLALDPCSATLFVTYEGSNVIEMVNAKTMISEQNPKTVTGAGQLAGIVFDPSKQKLYVVQRGSNKLYVYLWNASTKTLTLEGGTYKTLAELGFPSPGAYGLALDESNDRLYVTDSTRRVRYYDTNDPNWAHKGSIDITVNGNDRAAVGIAVDPDRNYLYTGAYSGSAVYHDFLVRANITNINNPLFTEKNVGAYVIGIAADQDTGLVYITTSNSHIEVYDTTTFPSDPCHTETDGISGPADIYLAGDVSYKPPLLGLEKDDGLDPNDPNDCVSPGDYITYTISYDAKGHDANNVVITDYLPPEVNFISADSNGFYDSDSNTVTWQIGTLSPGDARSIKLTVKVDEDISPLETIINYCEMESKFTYNTVFCLTPDVIYVDKNAAGSDNGTSWDNAFTDLQSALDKAPAGYSSSIWVAAATYETASGFALVDGAALYGGFPPGGGTWNDRDPNTHETIISGDAYTYTAVSASNVSQTAIIDGFTIRGGGDRGVWVYNGSPTIRNNKITNNGYGIECEDSYPNIISCVIKDNRNHGIYCYDGGGALIKNNLIAGDNNSSYDCGILLESLDTAALIRNNTIVYDKGWGIWLDGGQA